MADADDGARNLALGAVAGGVALVLLVAIAAAIASASRQRTPLIERSAARTAFGPIETLYFAQGSDKLNAAATEALHRLLRSAAGHPGAAIVVAAVQPSAADAHGNPRLDYQRALAVRHALEARGIAPARITIVQPVAPGPRDDARRARRVELRLE
jgi:outer membrane protein OmpA-like peptidoglycan-associated protein